MKIKMYRSCDSEKFVKIEIVLLVHAVLTENLGKDVLNNKKGHPLETHFII